MMNAWDSSCQSVFSLPAFLSPFSLSSAYCSLFSLTNFPSFYSPSCFLGYSPSAFQPSIGSEQVNTQWLHTNTGAFTECPPGCKLATFLEFKASHVIYMAAFIRNTENSHSLTPHWPHHWSRCLSQMTCSDAVGIFWLRCLSPPAGCVWSCARMRTQTLPTLLLHPGLGQDPQLQENCSVLSWNYLEGVFCLLHMLYSF